jgi:hypothetical protein
MTGEVIVKKSGKIFYITLFNFMFHPFLERNAAFIQNIQELKVSGGQAFC